MLILRGAGRESGEQPCKGLLNHRGPKLEGLRAAQEHGFTLENFAAIRPVRW